MMNLGAILKMLGIKIPPETVKQIEDLIPKIPGIVQQGIITINAALRRYDDRLARIERTQLQILEALHERNSNHHPAGVGANGRALESGVNGAD
jgi:hypothetical protein